MTNEEIKKRFLFDIEMGYFKTDSNWHQLYFNYSPILYDKFLALLKEIGYNIQNLTSFNKDVCKEIFTSEIHDVYFTVDPPKKLCSIFAANKAFIGIFRDKSKIFNDIPDYVKEYKIND